MQPHILATDYTCTAINTQELHQLLVCTRDLQVGHESVGGEVHETNDQRQMKQIHLADIRLIFGQEYIEYFLNKISRKIMRVVDGRVCKENHKWDVLQLIQCNYRELDDLFPSKSNALNSKSSQSCFMDVVNKSDLEICRREDDNIEVISIFPADFKELTCL